jgi:hypothetical protein
MLIFAALTASAIGLSHGPSSWAFSEAFAADVLATRAVEVSSPPGQAAENAIVAVAQLQPATAPLALRRPLDIAALGLVFSLMVAMNLAFARHLKRMASIRSGSRGVNRQRGNG